MAQQLVKFRASRGARGLSIEASRGGPWVAGITGCDSSHVQRQLDNLHRNGHTIEDTADFAFVPTPAKEKKNAKVDPEIS
jgi:hypothetical protein